MSSESQKTFSWLASLLVGLVAICFIFVVCILVHSDKLKPTEDSNASLVLIGFIATIGLFCMTVLVYRLLGYMYDFHLRAMQRGTEEERKEKSAMNKQIEDLTKRIGLIEGNNLAKLIRDTQNLLEELKRSADKELSEDQKELVAELGNKLITLAQPTQK